MQAPDTGPFIDRGTLRRVLLVELNRMGDVVHALPAARGVRTWLPGAEITMMVDHRYGALTALEPCVDRTMTSERSSTIAGLIRTAWRVRRQKFDLVCSMSPIRRNALVTMLGRTRYAAGYLSLKRRTPNFLRQNHVRSAGFQLARQTTYGYDHISEAAERVCQAPGIRMDEGVAATPPANAEARPVADSDYIVIHPFAGWAYREWPMASVQGLIEEVLDNTPYSVAAVGGAEERDRLEYVQEPFSGTHRVQIHAGLPLDRLATLIKGAQLFIGTDSGPYQLCARPEQ